MPAAKWDFKSARAEASTYNSVTDFKYGSSGAYGWAERNGRLQEVCAPIYEKNGRNPRGHWTDERCMAVAKRYKVLSEFIAEEWACYKQCMERGIREEATAHMVRDDRQPKGHWNVLENVIKEARKYVSRTDWQQHNPSSYNAAHRNGWIDLPEVTGHMFTVNARPAGYWQDPINWAQLIDSARQYATRGEWEKGASAEHNAARKIGGTLLEACYAMFDDVRPESDVVYIWAVVEEGESADLSKPLDCKVGVTRSDLGDKRIVGCARNNGQHHEVVHMVTVEPGKAFELEGVILGMGVKVDMPYWYDGYTEFRRFGTVTIRQAIAEMNRWAIKTACA